jgi:hypothetical protein
MTCECGDIIWNFVGIVNESEMEDWIRELDLPYAKAHVELRMIDKVILPQQIKKVLYL